MIVIVKGENMRVKVRIGKDTVVAFKEVERILQDELKTKLTNGDLLSHSWERISSKVNYINWLELAKVDIYKIINDYSNTIVGVQTTLTIEEKTLNSIKEFQFSLAKEFGQLVYFPFVVKLILFAAILDDYRVLEQYMK